MPGRGASADDEASKLDRPFGPCKNASATFPSEVGFVWTIAKQVITWDNHHTHISHAGNVFCPLSDADCRSCELGPDGGERLDLEEGLDLPGCVVSEEGVCALPIHGKNP